MIGKIQKKDEYRLSLLESKSSFDLVAKNLMRIFQQQILKEIDGYWKIT